MLGVMKEMVKVNVCAVSETWLNEYDNDAMKAEAMDGWGLVGKDGKEEALVCWQIGLGMERSRTYASNVVWLHIKGLGMLQELMCPNCRSLCAPNRVIQQQPAF